MLCSLRMIHSEDAGIPTAAASIIRVAIRDTHVRSFYESERKSRLTDIAPYGSFVHRVTGPHNGIDELVEACKRGPEHVEAGPGIPSLKMPWKRYQYQDETKERRDGEEGVKKLDHGLQGRGQIGERATMIKGYGVQRGIVGRSWKTMDVFFGSASQRSRN